MDSMDNSNRQAAGIVSKALGTGLAPGELGVLMASAGSGKTACLTLIAIEQLLHDLPVLHVCIDEKVESVKVWYQETLKNLCVSQTSGDYKKCLHRLEPLRFIFAFLHDAFSPQKLAQRIENLRDQAGFQPSLVVIDGLNFDQMTRPTMEEFRELARRLSLPLWFSARTHRHIATTSAEGVPYPCDTLADLFQAIVMIESGTDKVRLLVLKHRDQYHPPYAPVALDPQTFLIKSS
jgi:hypothetical protein